MGRADDTEWKKTACILCECNCGLEVQLGGDDNRELIRFRGDKAHPSSRGYACEKPHRLNYYQNGSDRLTTPLRREPNGSFVEIDWDTAIAEVSARLAQIRDTHSGDAIFYYGGGGQGNHLPGAYSSATRRLLKSRYRSNALAQEKTGEFWISSRMIGAYTRGDFEHCELALFIGKNPWYSHSIPRARVTLKEIARDPQRTLVVIDPRRTKTAEMADIHLQVKPGTDAWLLAAIIAEIVNSNLVDQAFTSAHTDGLDTVLAHLGTINVDEFSARCGVSVQQIRELAERIGRAASVATFEDLGVQMNRHSTLVSYLHRLIWMLTGNFGKPGTQYIPTALVPLATGKSERNSPVEGAKIIGGMVPCNIIAEEILTDHPKRYRAMIVEAANPAHSIADSKRFRDALEALDTLVVIDVAMSETARCADYVLPSSSQYEKAEATFFNFEYPKNYFHLRRPILSPPASTGASTREGPLPEAEIHARLVEALGGLVDVDLSALQEAAADSLERYANVFFATVATNPSLRAIAPVILYRTLGPSLGDGLTEGAVLFGAALGAAMASPASLARAGFDGPPLVSATKLFQSICDSPSGLIFAIDEWKTTFERIGTATGKIQLALDDMLEELDGLAHPTTEANNRELSEYPFVLSAGERRSFTANTILRNPAWRQKDNRGALRIAIADAQSLGLSSGDDARVITKRDSVVVTVEVSDTMQAGHLSLPNGLGVNYPETGITGAALNELTSAQDRDPLSHIPWHKHVRARVEAI